MPIENLGQSTRHLVVLKLLAELATIYPQSKDHRDALRELDSDFVYAAPVVGGSRVTTDIWITTIRLAPLLEDRFGIYREIAAIYSPHADLQGRTISRIPDLLNLLPPERRGFASGVVFFWAPDTRLVAKLDQFTKTEQVLIPLIGSGGQDQLRAISSRLYSQDLYRERTYVTGDQFFGRRTLLQELRADLHSQKVPAIFGTRKTGKTSILQELVRTSKSNSDSGLIEVFIYQDLEHLPALTSGDPIPELMMDLAQSTRVALKERGLRTKELAELPSRPSILQFRQALSTTLLHRDNVELSLVLILDEIEHLCPPDANNLATSAETDKVPQFFGVLRKLVQELDNFNFAIAGLASAVVESGELFGRHNPLFSLTNTYYLAPFEYDESRELLRGIGARLGLEWENDAIRVVHDETGGQVILLRELGSQVSKRAPRERLGKYRVTISDIEAVLPTYRRTVPSQIQETLEHVKRYYSDEYDLARELLHDPRSFNEISLAYPAESNRLINLGLAREDNGMWAPTKILELGWEPSDRLGGTDSIDPREEPLDAILMAGETGTVEFKSTARTPIGKDVNESTICESWIKAIIGFLNARGGTLLIGVSDDGEVIGLVHDLKSLSNSIDKLIRFVTDKVNAYIGTALGSRIRVTWVAMEPHGILRIDVPQYREPVFPAKTIGGRTDQLLVRQNANTITLGGLELIKYCRDHFS